MSPRWIGLFLAAVSAIAFATGMMAGAPGALADECPGGFIRSSIAGEGSRVKLGLKGQTGGCGSQSTRSIANEPQPYFTYEISCSTDRAAAAEGICSTTPCASLG